MHAEQHSALLDTALKLVGVLVRNAGAPQHAGHAAGHVAGGFPQPGRERPRRDDRTDARHHDSNGREDLPAQFPEARGGTGVLDVRAGRGVHLLGEGARFVMAGGDDGDLIAGDTGRVQGARSRGGGRRIREQAEDERVRHSRYVTSQRNAADMRTDLAGVRAGRVPPQAPFDAAIIGGGPAGAWLGYRLASSGARVAIVDGSHPREKPCGGGVSARALAVLRSLPDVVPRGVAVSGARFAVGGASAAVPLRHANGPAMPLVVVSRREFDGALLQAAIRAGAHHVPARATGIARTSTGWTVATPAGALAAHWLAGADGANSFVRRHVLRPFTREDLSVASGYFVHGRTDTQIDIEFTEAPPGYLWSFPRPDHLAVGICGQADGTTSAELLAGTARWIARHVPGRVETTRYSWPIPSLTERAVVGERPAGDRWLLLGDAAGLVDPITREGIFFALESADLAARALLGRDAARTYVRLLQRDVLRELRKAARMKPRFFASSFNVLLVDALRRSGRIRRIMGDLVSGEQTYRGLRRRLLMTGEARLAYEYMRLGG